MTQLWGQIVVNGIRILNKDNTNRTKLDVMAYACKTSGIKSTAYGNTFITYAFT